MGTMKTAIIAVAATAGLLLTGCSREELDTRGEIRLGVRSTATRAAIDNVTDLSQYAGSKVGVIGVETPGTGSAWDGTLTMPNVQTTSIDTDGTLYWSGKYYYPLDGTSVRFCAYHPYAATGTSGANYVEQGSGNTAPALHFTITGAEDVMYAVPVAGSRDQRPDKLDFRHVLTRLQFKLDDPNGNLTGQTLEGITVRGAHSCSTMNIETGARGPWTIEQDLSMELTPVAISAESAPQAIDGSIMLEPDQSDFTIDIATSGGTISDVKIKPTAAGARFEAGKCYEITLKFLKQTEIELSATVKPWEFGGTGEGVVE